MLDSRSSRIRASLREVLAVALLALGVVFSGPAACQTPGYDLQPDQWAPYESGIYLDRLHALMTTYRMSTAKIDYLRFEIKAWPVGPIELFRVSLDPQCSEDRCFFALFSSDLGDVPFVTFCHFKRGKMGHLFNPDRSNFSGFEFSCRNDDVLQVKVDHVHFGATIAPKR